MIVTRCPPTRAPGTTIEYVPFSRVSAPRLSSGILTSAYVSGTPASLVTRPVTTDCCAAAQLGSRATAPMTRSNGRRVIAMFPPTVRGMTGLPRPGAGAGIFVTTAACRAGLGLALHIIARPLSPPEGRLPSCEWRDANGATMVSAPSNGRLPV